MAFKFNDKAPIQRMEVVSPAGILTGEVKEVRGVYPFGPSCNIITDSELTDNMAEYLLGKEEFKDLITEIKQNTKDK